MTEPPLPPAGRRAYPILDESALDRLDTQSSPRILVAGDVMLDRYVEGVVERISPEAPVPVLRATRRYEMPGGAGNVARNLAALGARTALFGRIGADAAGTRIGELLREEGIEDRLVRRDGVSTIVKTRFLSGAQHVLRVDEEALPAINREGDLAAVLEAALTGAGALILSDYAKGTLDPAFLARALEAAGLAGVPAFVDPKARDFTLYRGATCISPNARELALATGLPVSTGAEVEAAARTVIDATGIPHVLVTRSENGLMLVSRDEAAVLVPARAREVFDVSGAGDTVIAVAALGLASGLGWAEAAVLANAAAGIVVGKRTTAVCTRHELRQTLASETIGKVMLRDTALDAVEAWREKGLRVGFTNGCFDLLHEGHLSLIEFTRRHCDRLVVAVNSDASVARLKGPTRPLQGELARARLLASLSPVDLVTVFDEDTPLALIEAIRPDVLVKGADYTVDAVVGSDVVASYGGTVLLAPLRQGVSTTNIIARAR